MRHEKINKEDNPCEEAKDYSYLTCIYGKIIQEVGCQPYYLDFDNADYPKCNITTKLRQFIDRFTSSLIIMDESVMFDTFNCLRPCNYMEYRVRAVDLSDSANIKIFLCRL